jgi:hypothetical protein
MIRHGIARWLAPVMLLALSQQVLADAAPRVRPLPAYQRECGSCHVAYPPGMLPVASWQRLMNDLPNHFGTDASLDAEQVREIGGWLAAHAGRRGSAERVPEDRITRTAWFIREHRKVAQPVWKRPAVGGAANCAACHTRAEEGDFDERHIRIPR